MRSAFVILSPDRQAIHRLAPPLAPIGLEPQAGIELLCAVVFGMHGQVELPAARMQLPNQLNKGLERRLAIALALLRMIDEEVVDPVLIPAIRLVGQLD